jgi:hypothetical protein
LKNLKGRDHIGYLSIHARIMFECTMSVNCAQFNMNVIMKLSVAHKVRNFLAS